MHNKLQTHCSLMPDNKHTMKCEDGCGMGMMHCLRHAFALRPDFTTQHVLPCSAPSETHPK